jgi:glycosyltransferase involved in cell wall biosynthesis
MRIAHWSIFAPHRSGMYETTRDLILAQRDIGIDCAMIDAQEGKVKTDGTFRTEEFRYADTADIYVMHLAIPEPYLSDGTPVVIALHGNPLYSMQTELYHLEPHNDTPFTTVLRYFSRTAPTWFASMWREEQGAYWDAIDGDRHRMRYIPRGIRFADIWTHDGPGRDLAGDPCIVIADQFRYFKDAIPCLWGAYQYWRQNPGARVYLYGLPPRGNGSRDTLDRWVTESNLHRMIGGAFGVVDYLPEVFRRADVLLSTVTGESRVVLEAQACGCPVVAPWIDADASVARFWDPQDIADAIDNVTRSRAGRDRRARLVREKYDIAATARGWQALYEEIMAL